MLKIKKSYIVNVSLFLIVLLITLFFIEFSLKLFLPQGNPLWAYDQDIGIKLVPDKCSRYVSNEYDVKFCTNKEGFIDDDHKILKEESITRIALLGDSFVLGKEVNDEERFTKLIEDYLGQECNNRLEFLNFGVGGQGTSGQLLTFNHYVKKYNPDYTFLFIFPENDVSNNYLPLEDRNYVPTHRLNDQNKLEYVPFQKPHIIGNPVLSFVFQGVFPNLFSLTGKTFRTLSKSFKGNEQGLPKYVYVYSENYSEDYIVAWKIEELLLMNLKKETESIDSELVVFLLFSRKQLSNFEDISDNPLVSTFDKNKPNRKFSEILKRHDIKSFDLLSSVLYEDPDYKELFFKYDQHLTPKGHELVAEMIQKRLLKETSICKIN